MSEETSRYKFKEKPVEGQLSTEEIKELCVDLRATFNSGVSTPIAFRLAQLKALKKFITDEREALQKALQKDLHKNSFESDIAEIDPTLSEVEYAIKMLPKWIKPKKKGQTPTTAISWNYTVADPLGCCLIIGAWNYPIYLLLGPLVGAIAGGNCAVLKPGSFAEATSKTILDLLPKYLDKRCFKVLEGNPEVTNDLLAEKWDKIFFTGSAFVGKIVAVAAAKHLTPVVLELGGKSPAIVDKSSNLTLAAERLTWGACLNGGQTCVRPDFILVEEKVGDKLIEKMVKALKKMFGEDSEASTELAWMINKGGFDRVSGLIEAHKDKVAYGGKSVVNEASGKFYIEPTIIDFGSDLKSFAEARVMQDEIFGPIIPLCRYKTEEEALDFVNNLITGKPLALYTFSTKKKFIEKVKYKTTSGSLCVNDVVLNLSNHHLPFGGVGNSGMGNYHGEYSFKCFTHEKAVLEKSQNVDTLPVVKQMLAVRYPPYTNFSRRVVSSLKNPVLQKLV
eukprot:snap_masked-scaffold_33-processed-gene-2.46-mRNA-1 protein AED:0.03 eAED:0.03 QI:0/-1/0/1/-1/1/1/0/505